MKDRAKPRSIAKAIVWFAVSVIGLHSGIVIASRDLGELGADGVVLGGLAVVCLFVLIGGGGAAFFIRWQTSTPRTDAAEKASPVVRGAAVMGGQPWSYETAPAWMLTIAGLTALITSMFIGAPPPNVHVGVLTIAAALGMWSGFWVIRRRHGR